MNQYPLWRYVFIVSIILLGLIYASPNLFPQDYSIFVSFQNRAENVDLIENKINERIDKIGVKPKTIEKSDTGLIIKFDDHQSRSTVMQSLNSVVDSTEAVLAYGLSPTSPKWLELLGASPMFMGLDLRGGVHFLMQVDTQAVKVQKLNQTFEEVKTTLREQKIRYQSATIDRDRIKISFGSAKLLAKSKEALNSKIETIDIFSESDKEIAIAVKENYLVESLENALQQNLTTLRNRVNEFGVSEPVIQRQGQSRVVVQLPGIEDTAQAKKIIGATASLEFRMVFMDGDIRDATSGRLPVGSQLFKKIDGSPVLLEKKVLLTGEYVIDASSGFDQQSGSPAVFITLDGKGSRIFSKVTRERIGRPMAVVFIEQRKGKRFEEVINIATIRDQLSKRFQITGLANTENARTLALLLRAGSLAAPMEIIQERTVGPTLGETNIRSGYRSVIIGLVCVMFFMLFYYGKFGLFANLALLVNLVLIIAVLSALQATLTLPGIAGIVLTVGMAVDANVLIFQRIREEIANGNTPQMSIASGYKKAFSTIADANITTLIAALVLFSFGTGPVKGFAITLSIGIVTSMFTAIVGTRAIVNLLYGKKAKLDLKI
ncbi:MAG: protein translocase subunit SecD [Methylococcaceae bacterium TMED69]|nr:MAG: protein translocase subunit SecD [Methylococcaceae bacterium TMED69]|tara:strand:- start:2249 stop:4060 length:1812 start_codon:yes stop_codon:yes gene_type:complete